VGAASEDHGRSSGWWKPILLALGAVAAAVVAWGAVRPEPEEAVEDHAGIPVGDRRPVPEPTRPRPDEGPAPAWVKPTIGWTIAVVVGVGVGLFLLGVLQQIVLYVLLALFFSFALEPAVNRLHARGWRRGSATGLLLAVTFVLLLVVGAIFLGSIIRAAITIVHELPEWADKASAWLSDTFGIDVSTDALKQSAQGAESSLQASEVSPVSVLLGFSMSLIGGIFAMFTVGMFLFYMVAEGPKFKRAVLSFFPRQRQEELVSIWEAAIVKTGGYFYSKLLLTAINGGLFFVVLLALGVPGAAALALFQGVVAEFIPIVGTYIAAVVPLVAAFFSVGMPETLILLIYVLIYQQVENYLLAPRFQAKTMELHPAVAFGAALAGGAIGGLLWAFLALPFAATIQASASLYIQHHEVVEAQLLAEPTPPPEKPEKPSLTSRAGHVLRSSRGWLHRRRHDAEAEVDAEPASE
jgi:predicted PurR-regulated permease PerM